jgi:hypothetical protein
MQSSHNAFEATPSDHRLGDVPALFSVAIVLAILTPRARQL